MIKVDNKHSGHLIITIIIRADPRFVPSQRDIIMLSLIGWVQT